ncbi:hypothetical protein CJF31_00010797 [Rutstroemia sp. NJR-2017a BVV2]|nr:hypothetical protein CJF31_00010797 [Rutstroemia sp. NJR-2017a BVV2]
MRGSLQTIREPMDDFSQLRELVRSSEKIVVISGAGISVSAGCELKLFLPLRIFGNPNRPRSTALYSSSGEMISFHSTVRGMCERLYSDLTEPSHFHKVMDELARTRLYFRHYTQNVDCVERLLPDLDAKTIRLYGRVDQARCGICNWKPYLFQGSDLLYCQRCLQRSQARILKGKRSLTIGRLRLNVLLYGEPHPDDKEILEAAKYDLRICPELVLIVGTKLRIPGAKSIAADFCYAARSVGGASFWISKEEPASDVKSYLSGPITELPTRDQSICEIRALNFYIG